MTTQYKPGELGPGGFPVGAFDNLAPATPTIPNPPSGSTNNNSSSPTPTNELPTYRADPTTGAIDYSNQLNPNYTEPTVTEPEIPTVDYQAQLAEQQAMQESINQQMLDLQNTYTQTLTDLSATIEQANAQNLNMFTAGNQALMTQVEQSARAAVAANSNTVANDDFINAAFQAFHGKNASDEELKIYSGKSIEQSLQAIKLGAPKKTPGSGLGDFTNGNITEDGLNINNNLASDIADKIPEDPINTFTEVKAPELATQTEIEMLRLMDTYRENIGQLMEQQSSIMSNMQAQITNTLEQWNIPEMINAAWKQSDIEGSMANAQQFVNQANNLFDTVYSDTADGSIPTKVLSRANAGKFAGLQAAANLNMGYANDANNIINNHYTMMQNSITSRISAYQSVMSEAGLNTRTALNIDANVLTNQINTLSDINSRIETKKQTILDFMATGAAKFGEAIDLDNDTDEQIANKISMANLKYGIYNTYAQQYPDTLQFMDSSMTLDELQNAINFSQIYKNSQEAIRAQAGLTDDEEDIDDTILNNLIKDEYNVDFTGNFEEDKKALTKALNAIETDYKNNNIVTSDYTIQKNALWDKFYKNNPNYQDLDDTITNNIQLDVEAASARISKARVLIKRKAYESEITRFVEEKGMTVTQAQIKLLQLARFTDEEIYSALGEIAAKDLGLTNVGSDTESALPSSVASDKIGTVGGQCGHYVNQNTNLAMPNEYEGKMALRDTSLTEPEAGMVFIMPVTGKSSAYGHTGFIKEVKGDKVLVKDSNWSNNNDEIIREHWIDKNKITGLIKV